VGGSFLILMQVFIALGSCMIIAEFIRRKLTLRPNTQVTPSPKKAELTGVTHGDQGMC
jgi:hypothetical protein